MKILKYPGAGHVVNAEFTKTEAWTIAVALSTVAQMIDDADHLGTVNDETMAFIGSNGEFQDMCDNMIRALTPGDGNIARAVVNVQKTTDHIVQSFESPLGK